MKKVEDKLSGSYYTPYRTVDFMKKYVRRERKIFGKVLEPSVGDGRFLDVFYDEECIQQLVGIELSKDKVEDLKGREYPEKVKIVIGDFLDFAEKTKEKYQLIVGNPPYINLKNMDGGSKEKAKKICQRLELSDSLMKNMWVAFLLAAVSCLEKRGVIFFVLPLEFLQVQYAEKIRLFLEERFNVIHILSFKERMFPEIEQESCLVYLTNEMENQPYINFEIYEKLDSDTPYYSSKIERNKPLKKWTNAVLADEDIDLLNVFSLRYKKVSELCNASPGIVTGANQEFILTREQVKRLICDEYVLATIPKSSMLNRKLILSQNIMDDLGEQGNRIYLLNLSDVGEALLSQPLKDYLGKIGEEKNAAGIKLKNRYKCRNRKPWYGVPIVRNGDLFFFKRYDRLPRVIVNEADAYTTDIAYNMRLYQGYDKKSMGFCFYNSLTLTQCEYCGRYYAGGVLELTPSEFKSLVIPYRKISNNDVKRLEKMFSENEAMDKIIGFVDSRTIAQEWEKEKIKRLDGIRKKLMERRLFSR
ncbi:MAG: Eco57I restriction-modification methylase domain-containing protein [Lachnospiraceae bacterium]|nr:Eco57I restriction-modification methylase domain-containing protein [Lachnospiraceae bacterium]